MSAPSAIVQTAMSASAKRLIARCAAFSVNPAARRRLTTVMRLSNRPTVRYPMNEGAGKLGGRVGVPDWPQTLSRALNAEFVDIQIPHSSNHQFAKPAQPKGIGSGSEHMQVRYECRSAGEPHITEQFDFMVSVHQA